MFSCSKIFFVAFVKLPRLSAILYHCFVYIIVCEIKESICSEYLDETCCSLY